MSLNVSRNFFLLSYANVSLKRAKDIVSTKSDKIVEAPGKMASVS